MTSQNIPSNEEPQENPISRYQIDSSQLGRLSRNMADFYGDLLKEAEQLAVRAEPIRRRISADVHSILSTIPDNERGVVLTMLVSEMQKVYDRRGSPKVELFATKNDCAGG